MTSPVATSSTWSSHPIFFYASIYNFYLRFFFNDVIFEGHIETLARRLLECALGLGDDVPVRVDELHICHVPGDRVVKVDVNLHGVRLDELAERLDRFRCAVQRIGCMVDRVGKAPPDLLNADRCECFRHLLPLLPSCMSSRSSEAPGNTWGIFSRRSLPPSPPQCRRRGPRT